MPATFSSTSYTPDRLLAGEIELASRKVTLLSGEATRTRGAVLGRKITAATVASAAAAGNTGNGTLTGAAIGTGAQEGVYSIRMVEPGTNLGNFIVEDPRGVLVGQGVVGTLFNNQIQFTINDGATDFAVADGFTVTVSAATYKYLRSVATATDGSQRPVAILAEDADATAADVECLVYERGDFNEGRLNFGTGHTKDTVRDQLRALGIRLVTPLQ